MNDGMLSQDEIDALLKISAEEDGEMEPEQDQAKTIEHYFSTLGIDTLGEIGNISFGSSATTLSTLLNQKVEITTPTVSIMEKETIMEEFTFEHVCIQVSYVEGFSGSNVFVIRSEDAAVISDIMRGGDGADPEMELTDLHLSAVQEVMNQMMGAAATSMSTVFDKRVDISPPAIQLIHSENRHEQEKIQKEEVYVRVSFQLKVGQLIDSNIMQLIPLSFAKRLVDQLLNGSDTKAKVETAASVAEMTKQEMEEPDAETTGTTEKPASEHRSEPTMTDNQYLGEAIDRNQSNIRQASFSEFTPVELNQQEQRNLDMLLDIPLKVTVELGRTKRTIRDILDLSTGSIVELDKLAGEPVDIFINEKRIATGEVVVIDENFGVRVTDIISQSARLMKLK